MPPQQKAFQRPVRSFFSVWDVISLLYVFVALPLQSVWPRTQFTMLTVNVSRACLPYYSNLCARPWKEIRAKTDGGKRLRVSWVKQVANSSPGKSPSVKCDIPVAAGHHAVMSRREGNPFFHFTYLPRSSFVLRKSFFVCNHNLIWVDPSSPQRQFTQQKAPKGIL